MCVVSMVGDYYTQRWSGNQFGQTQEDPLKTLQTLQQGGITGNFRQGGLGQVSGAVSGLNAQTDPVTRPEFAALKNEVLEMKELLKRALDYDEKNNEPHCEQEEKIALLKRVAEAVGVSLDDVFGAKK